MVKKMNGFTLIELIVVVTVIGLLASIAVPSYQDYIRRTDRADARTALLENAQFLERNFTEATRYDQTAGAAAVALPIAATPRNGTAKYDIAASVLTASTFQLDATPRGSMAADACGTLSLTHLGAKLASGSLGIADCWNR